MAKQATDSAAIAAFMAKRGVTKVDAGVSALGHMTGRDWHRAARDTVTVQARETQRLIEERHYVVGANGVEHCRNGLGEWIY